MHFEAPPPDDQNHDPAFAANDGTEHGDEQYWDNTIFYDPIHETTYYDCGEPYAESREGPYTGSDIVPQDIPGEAVEPALGQTADNPIQPLPEELSQTVQGVEMAVQYVAGAALAGMRSYLQARNNGEPTRPAPRQTFEDDGGNKITDLADYDEPPSRQRELAFDIGLNTIAYEQALADAGLGVTSDPFMVSFSITDGEKLAAMLNELPAQGASDLLRTAVHVAMQTSFFRIQTDHHPLFSTYGPSGDTRFTAPAQPADGVKDYSDTFPPESAVQALMHAGQLCEAMAHAGIDEATINRLRNAHMAEVEGMLPFWAVANSWHLYDPPTTNARELQWTTWSPQEWDDWVDPMLTSALGKAPAGSAFMRTLAETLNTNINRLRARDFTPAITPREVSIQAGYNPDHPRYTGNAALLYNAALDHIQRRLQRILATDL